MQKFIINILLITSFFITPIVHAQENNYYNIIYSEVSMYNQEQTDWITNAILYASSTYSLDPLLLTALLEQESHFSRDYVLADAIGEISKVINSED